MMISRSEDMLEIVISMHLSFFFY